MHEHGPKLHRFWVAQVCHGLTVEAGGKAHLRAGGMDETTAFGLFKEVTGILEWAAFKNFKNPVPRKNAQAARVIYVRRSTWFVALRNAKPTRRRGPLWHLMPPTLEPLSGASWLMPTLRSTEAP